MMKLAAGKVAAKIAGGGVKSRSTPNLHLRALDRALLLFLPTRGNGQPMARLWRSIIVHARRSSLFHLGCSLGGQTSRSHAALSNRQAAVALLSRAELACHCSQVGAGYTLLDAGEAFGLQYTHHDLK